MDETLKTIEQFHGHLGPYVILGYKMGIIANNHLGSDPFEKTVIVTTGTNPPISCLIDGIQISSGCTLGKGSIKVTNESIPKAMFSNKKGDMITIALNKNVQQEIDNQVTEENMSRYSEDFYNRLDTDLFIIE